MFLPFHVHIHASIFEIKRMPAPSLYITDPTPAANLRGFFGTNLLQQLPRGQHVYKYVGTVVRK